MDGFIPCLIEKLNRNAQLLNTALSKSDVINMALLLVIVKMWRNLSVHG